MREKLIDVFSFSILFIIFCIQPFFTFIFFVIFNLFITPKKQTNLYFIAFFGALYISLINLTKIPESDLLYYLQALNDASNLDIGEYLIINAREPLFYLILYLIGNINWLGASHFILLSSFFPYMIFLSAVIKLCYKIKLSNRIIIAFLIFLLFFPQLFNISAHLLRQFIACSIMVYFLSLYIVNNKRSIFLGVVAFFNHFSVILVFFLNEVISLSRSKYLSSSLLLISTTLMLLIFFSAAYFFAQYLTEIPMIGIIFQRLIDPTELVEHAAFSLFQLAFAFMISCLSIFNILRSNLISRNSNAWVLHILTILVSLMVLVASFIPGFNEVALRFSMFLYFLMGLILPFTFHELNKIFNVEVCLIALIPIIISSLFYKTQFGVWTYAELVELLVMSFYGFWNYF